MVVAIEATEVGRLGLVQDDIQSFGSMHIQQRPGFTVVEARDFAAYERLHLRVSGQDDRAMQL